MTWSEAGSGSPRTGLWLFPDSTASELVDAIVAADEAGVDEVWVADEGVMREPAVVLAAAAVNTRRIRLGVGITSIGLRHPGAVASSFATIDELSNGRAMLGLGIGGDLSLQPFGERVDRPVGAMRHAIRVSRAVLARTSVDGYTVPDHAAPARRLPVYVGSHGEQINRLASAEADGVFLSGFAPDRLTDAVEWARSVRPIEVALYQSIRFDRADESDDPTSITGDVDTVARALSDLVARHRPASIGLALVDGRPLPEKLQSAFDVFARFGA